jgi:hypothetical protein
MSQHDLVIDNGPGLAVRTDMNAAIQALASQNAGPVEPTTKYAGMLWLDTGVTPNVTRQRNQANTAWITPTVLGPNFGNIVQTVVTTSGTWTKPAGLLFLEVTAVGGGGGSRAASGSPGGQSACSGGGGGAGTATRLYAASELASSEAFTIAAGGAVEGGTGGSTTFKGMVAGGGGPGAANTGPGATFTISAGGVGGGASGGTLHIVGENGGYGVRTAHGFAGAATPGDGGGSFLASRYPGVLAGPGGVIPGVTGNFPGGGATGVAVGSGGGTTGAAGGGAGCIVFKEYF